MEKIYNKNLLISLVYNELDALDRMEMEYAVSMDSISQDAYQQYHKMKQALPKITFSPMNQTIDAIMSYARG